ncbi:MAG: hypothetical protein ACMXYF_05895 [Candidatus Woesearchaeota archaeon]
MRFSEYTSPSMYRITLTRSPFEILGYEETKKGEQVYRKTIDSHIIFDLQTKTATKISRGEQEPVAYNDRQVEQILSILSLGSQRLLKKNHLDDLL